MKNIYREIKWKNQERGHWRPFRILYKPEAEFKVKWFRVLVDRIRIATLDEKEKPYEKELAKEHAEELKGISKRNYGVLKELVGWMDEEYAGKRLAKRLRRTEIALVTYPEWEVDLFMSNMIAAYRIGTNVLQVQHVFDKEFGSEAFARERIAHELHHYAAYLEGGMQFRWRDDEGNAVFRKHGRHPFEGVRIDWFQEALTNMLAHTLLEAKGVAMTHRGYDLELLIALIVREITGEKELRGAYFSGDFTQIRRIMNEKLGEGSFERIIGRPDENGERMGARELIEKAEGAGINLGRLYSSRIVMHFAGQNRGWYAWLTERVEGGAGKAAAE